MGFKEPKTSLAAEWSHKFTVWLVALTVLVSVTALVLYLQNAPPADQDVAAKPDLLSPDGTPQDMLAGAPVIIGTLDSEDPEQKICLVRDVQDEETIANLIRTNDQKGMLKLIRTRRAIFVENRTPATFLERGPKLCRVRITNGDQRGKEVWVSPEFILREGPP